jgi:hypothetical protein
VSISLDVTQFIVLLAELAAGIWIWYMLHENSESTQNMVKAYLLAIRNDGIVPASAPIYKQFRIYVSCSPFFPSAEYRARRCTRGKLLTNNVI